MARTKRTTTQALPPASSTTEQEPNLTEEKKDEPLTTGDVPNETESKDHDGDNTTTTLDNENQTQPTTEDLAHPGTETSPATYTFKPPFGLSEDQINFKVLKIQSMFGYLSMDETYRMLDDCYCNEDEVMLRLITQSDYLLRIQTMLKNPNESSSSNADTPSTSSASTSVTDLPSLSSFQTQNEIAMPYSSQQQQHNPHHLHHYGEYEYPTAVIGPSQISLNPYQQPYPNCYRPLQPLIHLPMPSTESPPTTTTTTVTTTTTTNTSSSTVESSTSPKRGSNYGKKYKKRKVPNKPSPSPLPSMDDYGSMPPTPIPTSATLPLDDGPEGKKRIRSVGRLALDDALKQVKDNPMKQQQAYEGWSAARIRAYGLIDTNPNTYYYRFNAPGEEQHKGAWTQDEKELFLKRVKQVGANSQWGIFSMAIPGRVGYQCSNFYRLLIETGELFDDNYVIDDKGKAHYLFDKKTETGEIQKTIRNHYKHKKNRQQDADGGDACKKTKTVKKKKPKKRNPWDTDDDDDGDDGEYTGKPTRTKSGTRRSTRRSTYA